MKPKRLVPFLLVIVILVNSVGLVFADDTTNYTYDSNGNLISDGVQCFSYNDANQLAAVRTCAGNALVAEYVYDHTGQRIVEKHYQNGALQETVYTIGKHTETVVAAGGGRQDTTYYRSNNEIVARQNPDSSKTFYHQDHLGSTGALTDAGGQLVEETRYYPFGAVRAGGALGRFLYTGQESDAETGLYYYGARFYNPALARFVQPDSLLPELFDPQQLNRYSYAANKPLNYIDPSGHASIEPALHRLEPGPIGYNKYGLKNSTRLNNNAPEYVQSINTYEGVDYFVGSLMLVSLIKDLEGVLNPESDGGETLRNEALDEFDLQDIALLLEVAYHRYILRRYLEEKGAIELVIPLEEDSDNAGSYRFKGIYYLDGKVYAATSLKDVEFSEEEFDKYLERENDKD